MADYVDRGIRKATTAREAAVKLGALVPIRAAAAAIEIAVTRSHAALLPTGSAAFAAAAPTMLTHQHADALAPPVMAAMHENWQAVLLLVRKARVKRLRRVGDLLQRLTAQRQQLGTALEAVNGTDRRPGGAEFLPLVHHGSHRIACGALERRPKLFLISRQAKTGMDRRHPRIEERGSIFGREPRHALEHPSARKIERRRGLFGALL